MRGQSSLSRSRFRKPSSMSTPLIAPPERTTATSRSSVIELRLGRGTLVHHAVAENLVDPAERPVVELDARGGCVVGDLLRPRGADDGRRDVRLAEHPGERELRRRDPEVAGEGDETLDPFEERLVGGVVHEG